MSAQVVKYNGSLCQVTNLKFTGKKIIKLKFICGFCRL